MTPVRHYCTLFDRYYTVSALALYESLVRHATPFRLYALCMDEESLALLTKLNRPDLVSLDLESVVDAEILAAMRARLSYAQLCWSCQPFLCTYVLDTYAPPLITYLESDSYFFSSPEPLFEELGAGAASLVPHRYAPQFASQAAISGRYCVQFNAFANDEIGRAVLADWQRECSKYTRERPEYLPGQLALDHWQERFERVVEIEHVGAGVAPWNVHQYRIGKGPRVNGSRAVFFHFHQLSAIQGGGYFLSGYGVPLRAVVAFYRPYLKALARAEKEVRAADPSFVFRRTAPPGTVPYHALTHLLSTAKRVIRWRLRAARAFAARSARTLGHD